MKRLAVVKDELYKTHMMDPRVAILSEPPSRLPRELYQVDIRDNEERRRKR